jgi:molybdenum cofactor biosynthesis protein B
MSLDAHRGESPAKVRFAILTISDTRDAASDRGGAYLRQALEAAGHEVTWNAICRDDAGEIEQRVREAVGSSEVDLVITTGGTGLTPRDITYPTLEALFESSIPGFGELFRWLSYSEIGAASMLSRATAGLIRGKAVLALPGSPKALELAMREIILKEAGHIVSQLQRANPHP